MLSEEELRGLVGGEVWTQSAVGGGFQGCHWRLEAGDGRRWFVKCQPVGPTARTGAFLKEPGVYSTLLPALTPHLKAEQKLWPEVILSRQGVLVLEDLEDSGWRTVRGRLDRTEVQAGLEALADLHTAAWGLEEASGIPLNAGPFAGLLQESYFGEEPGHPGMASWRSFVNTARKIYSRFFPGRRWESALQLMDRAPYLVRPSSSARNTVCHGDPWQNNMFFKYQNGNAVRCCLVDWAQTRYCPPSLDALLFLYLQELDAREERFLLEHYWSRLEVRCDSGEAYARTLLPLYVYLTRLPEPALKEISASQEAFWNFATGEDRPALQALENDFLYRTVVINAFRKLLHFAESQPSSSSLT